HVLERLFAPSAARLGRSAQGVDQAAGLVADLPLPRANQLDGFAKSGVMVDALLFDRLQLLLIGLEKQLHRADRLGKLLAGLLDEGLACLAEQFGADLVALRRKALFGVLERFDLLLERFLPFVVAGFAGAAILACGG